MYLSILAKVSRLAIIISFLCSGVSLGQNLSGVINTYFQVTDVNMSTYTVTVDDATGLVQDDSLIIIQMKGAERSTEEVDTIHGNITNYNGAGSWELVEICHVIGNEIIFKKDFVNTYDEAGAVQLIKIETTHNAVVTDTLKCKEWDGATGGVLIVHNKGILDIQAPINVGNRGFRPGLHSESTFTCSFFTSLEDYDYDYTEGYGAQKGEGIVNYPSDIGGRGPLGNGGGGGNDHNSGGGGGSSLVPGGTGGENDDPGTFTCKGYFPGLGGRGLSTADYRLFMGGGGGAGHSNSTVQTSGGRGAGIVIIISDEINSNNQFIYGQGMNGMDADGDGAGGGGAGAAIQLQVDVFNGNLNIDISGGNGGNVDASVSANMDRCFGPGGGGSGGYVRFKGTAQPANVNIVQSGGTPGIITGSTAACNGSSVNALGGSGGLIEYNGFIPEGFKCNRSCDRVTNIDLGPDGNTCENDSIVLSAGNYPGASYNWSTGETTDSITFFGAGTVVLGVDDGYCISCDTVEVSNFSNPAYPSELILDVCESGVTLDAENPGATYYWSHNQSNDQTEFVNEAGQYYVLITNNSCKRWVEFNVYGCLQVPNMFTPNGDGYNDVWFLEGIDQYSNVEIVIQNRLGQIVFQTNDYQNNWDAAGLPGGVYYYTLELNDGTEKLVGSITVVNR